MAGMAEIYLMRHGETVWNVQTRLQGRRDSPLTATGVRQAEAFGLRLRALFPDVQPPAIASPLGRARQTAVIAVSAMGGDAGRIALDERLAEHAFGDWEGLTWEEVNRDHADSLAARMADRWNVPAPGGESYAAVAARVAAWLDEMAATPGPRLVFSHGVTSRVIRGLYAGLGQPDAMSLKEPQDRIFRLAGGRIEEIVA